MSLEADQNSEFQNIIEGVLTKKCLIKINDLRSQDQLRNKGYGDKEGNNYFLEPYEALYLIYLNKLVITNGNVVDFSSLLKHVLKYDKEIVTKFLVYRDLRSRGYVVKEDLDLVQILGYMKGEDMKRNAQNTYFSALTKGLISRSGSFLKLCVKLK
jgi:tRNA-intron endonuclease, archaea type